MTADIKLKPCPLCGREVSGHVCGGVAAFGCGEWEYETIFHERDQLKAENSKLRELVHDLLQPISADGFDCYGCVREDCNGRLLYTGRCKLLDRARKLGVRVP